MKVQLTNSLIRDYLKTLGYAPAPGKLHILGLRGAVPDGANGIRLVENRPDRYNDTLVLFGTVQQLYLASVDPGATYTRNPLHPDGCAHLTNGRWLYKLGLHQGKPALVQAAPVTVRRDKDRDSVPEPHEPLHTGWFGINIHAGGAGELVGPNSAGCQVIQGGWAGQPWKSFLGHCEGSRQATFEYCLIDAQALAEFAAKR